MHSITDIRQPGNDRNHRQRHPTINRQHALDNRHPTTRKRLKSPTATSDNQQTALTRQPTSDNQETTEITDSDIRRSTDSMHLTTDTPTSWKRQQSTTATSDNQQTACTRQPTSDNQETTEITDSDIRQSTDSMHSTTYIRQPGNDRNHRQRHPTINRQHAFDNRHSDILETTAINNSDIRQSTDSMHLTTENQETEKSSLFVHPYIYVCAKPYTSCQQTSLYTTTMFY
jgi:hypothetical protein